MFKKIMLLAFVMLAVGCSKDEFNPSCGGYQFKWIYLYLGGGTTDLHGMTISLPAEAGHVDIEVVTGRLYSSKCLEGDPRSISLEFPGPYEENPDDPWLSRQVIRVNCTANPSVRPRSCKYRIFASVADGAAADVIFLQKGRDKR